ncbi:ferrous iron transport protein A [Chloroflexia bacterium SDU3-3]|nr:ferrous iron transport protein A [Chloroflexia bacterium SDU3-3]
MSASSQLPLALAAPGQRLRLVALRCAEGPAHRLSELGLNPGATVEIVQDTGHNLLLAVGDTRLALRRSMAHMVMVEPAS